uniref:Uncharacterized protein n=1 Tax=Lygus hesperus TaxID=30085 RepID=A0A146LH78_LYGHE
MMGKYWKLLKFHTTTHTYLKRHQIVDIICWQYKLYVYMTKTIYEISSVTYVAWFGGVMQKGTSRLEKSMDYIRIVRNSDGANKGVHLELPTIEISAILEYWVEELRRLSKILGYVHTILMEVALKESVCRNPESG